MRKLLYISLTFLLVTAVMSCGRGVDKRLVQADSLMWTAPDSSLAILEAIDRDSLQGDENLAYHALLLTQAQFRCNGNCTGDRIIDKMDLLAKGNIIKGGTSIYCHNIGEMNAYIEGNYFESYNFTIALQDYGSSGNLTFIDNHLVIKKTGNTTFYYSTTGCGASRFCFANNVFEGVVNDIMSIILNYISSQNVININNILLN